MNPELGISLIRRLRRPFLWVVRSRTLTKVIFGLDVYPYPYYNIQNWDFATLLLKKALDSLVKDHQRILEIGTGHLAILSVYVAKKKFVDVSAVDINPAFVENARKNAAINGVHIELKQSDLFSNVDGAFDIVFFNPPYVPTRYVEKYSREQITKSVFDLAWNGGSDGFETIRRFLNEVMNVIHGDSIVVLGVNALYLDRIEMRKLITKAGLTVVSVFTSIGNPSRVYVMRKRRYNDKRHSAQLSG